MKALQWNGQEASVEQLNRPQPKKDEALVRVTCAGVCNTDIEITRGYLDFKGTLGHEFVGVVEETSDSSWVGKRIVCDINCACQTCQVCLAGDPHHCPHRSTVGIFKKDGAFAEYINVPIANLLPVPDSVSDEQAVFTEPLAAALEIQEQLDLKKDQPICVLGDGKLGLLIAMSLAAHDFSVTLIGHHKERESRLGGLPLTYSEMPPNHLFSTVIEATGNPQGFETAIKLTQPRGTIVLKSTYANGFHFDPTLIVVNEIRVQGSRCGPFDKALSLLKSAKLDPSLLIDHRYSLSDGPQALKQATTKGTLKVLIHP